jgi:mitochondrial chaperone BCS1
VTELLATVSQVLQNQFLSGGIVLMLSASVIALCRKLPQQLWTWFVRRVTVVVDVSNDDPLFAWLSLWLAEHPYSRRARTLTATSERDDYGRSISGPTQSTDDLPQVLFTPAPGNHLLWYKRKLVWLSRDRKDAPGKEESFSSVWKREVFTLRVIGRNQDAARSLLEDARGVALKRRSRKIEVFSACYDSWQRIDERDPRPLSSVFLPNDTADHIVKDVKTFLESQPWYAERGIPWRRGYLFHGVPGSGKTSLICALAGQFRMNLYILNLGNPYLTDDHLMALLSRVSARSFVLLEDVDAAFNQRDKSDEAKNKLTFSGLLNALCGAGSREGSLVFMTTNHLDRLDPALVRPGRADFRLEFGHATAEQANRMFLAFFPEADGADGFGDRVASMNMSMAEVQNHLIEHRDSCVRALNSLAKAA